MTERSAFGQDTAMPDPDLAVLAESWLVHLRAERKSLATLGIYRAGVRAYLAWCQENGQPAILDRNLLAAFTADLLGPDGLPAGWPLKRPPLLLETSIPGVFAAGDVRHRSVKRVASAVGEGAVAVQLVHQYLDRQ